MNDEKKHVATERRRRKAMAEGRVVKSQDFSVAALLLLAFCFLWFFGDSMSQGLMTWLADSLANVSTDPIGEDGASLFLSRGVARGGATIAPILVFVFLTAMMFQLIQTGLRFSPKQIQPNLNKISPSTGLSRIFSLEGGVRLCFGMLKLVTVFGTAFLVLQRDQELILGLANLDFAQLPESLFQCVLRVCLMVSAVLLGLSLLDYHFQRWKFERDIMMTDQELREEMKEAEANQPLRRPASQDLSGDTRSGKAVGVSEEIVITSAADVAIRIGFDDFQNRVPRVLEKGFGSSAELISGRAHDRGIRVARKTQLANALHALVKKGEVVPIQLRKDLFSL